MNGKKHEKGKEYEEQIKTYSISIKNAKSSKKVEQTISIYEGEYLNGKRHGKGKEYIAKSTSLRIRIECFEEYNFKEDKSFKLIFSGQYEKGKRKKGILYTYNNDKSIIENEYEDGKVNRRFKEYNINGQLIFEGEYLGNKNKKGKSYTYNNKDIFIEEGLFLKGKKMENLMNIIIIN